MPIFYGSNKITKIYYGSNKIGKVYYGSTLVYTAWKDIFMSTAGTQTIKMPPGTYNIILRGSGGAGGQAGAGYNTPGLGGAGGKGKIFVKTIKLTSEATALLCVGTPGSVNGNGGSGYATDGQTEGLYAGNGGGGAFPTYIQIGTTYYIAAGGGGGGGGAGGGRTGRYADGGNGGGGGGYYRMTSNGTITSIAGKNGARGFKNVSGSGDIGEGSGVAGNTTDFPNVYSGKGGSGWHYDSHPNTGGARAQGGGASGGGGGGWANNHTSGNGGHGGGGAGGCDDAGGGGTNTGRGTYPPETGTNYHVDPTDTTAENALYGVSGNYGMGGTGGKTVGAAGAQGGSKGTDGKAGFIKIVRIMETATEWDLGSVTDTNITETKDCGTVTDTNITETKDLGSI